MKITIFIFLFLNVFSAQADNQLLEFIKDNYEQNIRLAEQTYEENGIFIELAEEDRTIDLNKLESIAHVHPVAEVGYKLGIMKKAFLKKITPLEKELLKIYPKQAYYIGFQSKLALSKTEEIYQKDSIGKPIDLTDPRIDSFKHTYWSHRISHEINSEFAKLWFTARELKNRSEGFVDLSKDASAYMDFLNNVIGMKIPEDTFKERLLGNAIHSQILRRQRYGKLFFNDRGTIRTTDQID